ncbi:MAG: hypothetical protein ABW217_20105 [Polyangiaceae bacterium]
MKPLAVRLLCPSSLGDFHVSFAGEDGNPRPVTLIYGGPGSGKTTVLAAIAGTRPGYAASLSPRSSDAPCFARCEWLSGIDEPDHAHGLAVYSPNAPDGFRPKDPASSREAVFFDRLARDGGFVFVSFAAVRWFSKAPLMLSTPERTVLRYDVRASEPFDDASRNDLTRDVKQTLTYAAVVRVLPQREDARHRVLGEFMSQLIDDLAQLSGYRYAELDPATLEPSFVTPSGQALRFDAIPSALKHAVAFGALTVRALWAAYPGVAPAHSQAVVAIDEIELHQDATLASALIDVLTRHLPNVQWVITTRSSALLGCRDADEILALGPVEQRGVAIYDGSDARVH